VTLILHGACADLVQGSRFLVRAGASMITVLF